MGCSAPTITVDGVTLSSNTFENAQDLINEVGDDLSDPTADEYESYVAHGGNSAGTKGIHSTLPTQTTPPTPSDEKSSEDYNKTPPSVPTTNAPAGSWSGSYSDPISSSFILKDVTVGCLFPHPLTDLNVGNQSCSAQDRFTNLKQLSVNVLEKLKAKYGNIRINSGIRNENSVSNGLSQHCLGQAVDIQVPGWTYQMYWQNAQWVVDNIPFDQFIFEHSEKTKNAWWHLSYRTSNSRRKVMTMYKGHYDQGLKKFY